jgi:hypothetical protein
MRTRDVPTMMTVLVYRIMSSSPVSISHEVHRIWRVEGMNMSCLSIRITFAARLVLRIPCMCGSKH